MLCFQLDFTIMDSLETSPFSNLHSLNSLVTKCVHVLCHSDNPRLYKTASQSLSSLYDFNLIFDKRTSSASPVRLIELLYKQFHNSPSYLNGKHKYLLDIHSRQAIIDYIIRERIIVSADFIVFLLQDGGVYRLDLWQLCTINEFTSQEVETILHSMIPWAHLFIELSIGGSQWFYEFCITSGVLRKLLCKYNSLVNLASLKIQQIPYEMDFVSLLHACPKLKHLEISQPSLRNRDILKMTTYLNAHILPICSSLQSVSLPSSVKEEGLIYFLSKFRNITDLRCTHFEQMLDLLDSWQTNLSTNYPLAMLTLKVLTRLRCLSVAHPMSCDMIDRLVKVCPNIEQLSLEIQEGMDLSKFNQANKLSKLELHNSSSMPIIFTEHVVPVLKSCGHRLKSLSLEYFDHIDLTMCAQYCPNLLSFSAQWFSMLTIQRERYQNHQLVPIESPPCFSNLRYIRLRPRPHQWLSAETTSFILSSSLGLRHIELYCCTELTDDTIDAILSKNRLAHLQTFILRHGHNVSKTALSHLVSTSSSCNSLVFHDCGLVPLSRKEDM